MIPRNKEKRPSGSDGQFDRSFVKRVSGLLPSSITKWFSSQSSSNPNGTAIIGEVTDSATEDEGSESPVIGQPSAKRMRLSQSTSNQYLPTTTCASTNTDAIFLPQDSKETAPHKSYFKRDNNLLGSPLNSKTEEPEFSTPKVENRVSYILKNSLSSGDTPLVKKRRSLLDINRTTDKTSIQKTRSHKASSFLGSPFYPSKTTYGGASNSSFIRSQKQNEKEKTVVNKSLENSNVQMSTSARQIMDLLENYSSPLEEARRISQFIKADKSFNSFDTTSDSHNMSHRTQELHVPSLASILSIKKRSRLMSTTSAARQLLASQSSSSKQSPYPQCVPTKERSFDKFVTKITNNKSTVYEPVVPLDLPTNVLQIDKDNLPKLSFNKPTELIKLTTSKTKSCSTYNISETNQNTDYEVNNDIALEPKTNCYNFCKPVEMCSDIKTNNKASLFSFVNPEKIVDQLKDDVTISDSAVSFNTSPSEETNAISTLYWKCSNCLVKNNLDVDKCVCCDRKRPLDVSIKCTICKIASSTDYSNNCSHCEKKENTVSDIQKTVNALKWNCQDCWVSNEISSDNCVCCGGKKPLNKIETTKTEKSIEKSKCSNCLLENKCTDCSTSKQNSLLPSKNVGDGKIQKNISDTTDSFKMITKNQKEKWQCPICLVQNENDKNQCICCETEKPGTSKSDVKFNFGIDSNLTFKFGIQPKVKQTEKGNLKTELIETNNNVSPKTFSFGIPANNSNDKCLKSDVDKPTTKTYDEATTPTFTFGIPKEYQKTTVVEEENVTPKECDTLKKIKENIEVKKRVQQPSQIENNDLIKKPTKQFRYDSQKIVPNQTVTFSLYPPQKMQPETKVTLETTKAPTFSFNNHPAQTLSTNVASTVKVEKPVVNLSFNSTTSHKSSDKLETFPLFKKNKTTVTSSMPLFGNLQSPSSGTAEVSPFQPNDEPEIPTTTTSTLILTLTAPKIDTISSFGKTNSSVPSQSTTTALFNFGSNNHNTNVNSASMMKFNFGNNKTETSNMFSTTNSIVSSFSVPVSDNDSKFNPPKMDLPNLLTSNINSNGLSSGGNIVRGNGQTENAFSSNSVSTNTLNTGNTVFSGSSAVTNASGIFDNQTQKENSGWPSRNMFSTMDPSNANQIPSTFTFGGSMSLDTNSNNNVPTFGSNAQTTSLYGMPSANPNNNSSLFPASLQNTTSPPAFGNLDPPATNNNTSGGFFGQQPTSAMGGFGSSTSAFCETSNQSLGFNFSAGQSPGTFNFSQQPQQSGVYGFGGAAAPQFKVGSFSTPIQARPKRKAVRRTMLR